MRLKIHITGASGSGATSLASALGKSLAIHQFDTDSYLWLPTDPPFTQQRLPDEINSLLSRDLSINDSFILSGSVLGWGEFSKYPFTHVVFLDVPTKERIRRLNDREVARLGNSVLPGGDLYDSHTEFLNWASTYDDPASDGRNRARHEKWLATISGKLIRIVGSKSIDAAVSDISKNL